MLRGLGRLGTLNEVASKLADLENLHNTRREENRLIRVVLMCVIDTKKKLESNSKFYLISELICTKT